MRSYKKIMPILLTVALLGSAAYAIRSKLDLKEQYEAELREARRYAAMDVLSDAMGHYNAALQIQKSLPLALEIGDTYLGYNDLDSAQYWYGEVLLADYPKDAETYYYGMRLSEQKKDFAGLFDIYDDYRERGLTLDGAEQLVEKYRYVYSLSGLYDDAGVFSASSGLAAVKYNERWGAVNASGARRISYSFDCLGMIGDYGPAITKDGRAICVDAQGVERINENFILEKDPQFGHVTQFQNVYGGILLACNGSTWSYYRLDDFEKLFGGFADALPIYGGIGAVKENVGDKWRLISEDGSELGGERFDAILTDGKGIFCRDGIIIASVDGSYGVYNAEGEPLGAGGYSEAKAFNDSTLAAVRKNGNWLFVDQKGTEHDLGSFQEAESFSAGLAAVKKDGRWGYIDEQGEMVIENIFFGAGPFSQSGVSFVEVEKGQWQLLALTRLRR